MFREVFRETGFPASRSATFMPASVTWFAQPPVAPEPTTITSYVDSVRLTCNISASILWWTCRFLQANAFYGSKAVA